MKMESTEARRAKVTFSCEVLLDIPTNAKASDAKIKKTFLAWFNVEGIERSNWVTSVNSKIKLERVEDENNQTV